MRKFLVFVTFICIAQSASGQTMEQLRAQWNEPQEPFRIFGNTYYVGTKGLSSILVTSQNGHILIDGALPESAASIADNVRKLGFKMGDVKYILNSHVHFDHAGGIADLQALSGAQVVASSSTARVLQTDRPDPNDPQASGYVPIKSVAAVKVIRDGEKITIDNVTLTAHATPGHTPGGTSWTWQSCDRNRCLDIVYADSLNPISSPGYFFSDRRTSPSGETQLKRSFDVLSKLSCDVLLVPHPELAGTFEKLARRKQADSGSEFIDRGACRSYVEAARKRLADRLATERKSNAGKSKHE